MNRERKAARSGANLPRLPVFAYLDVDKTPVYRAIMDVFRRTKERFGIHLRPAEVRAALVETEVVGELGQPARHEDLTLEEVEVALKQLAAWGNLRSDPDTADVTTVEEFYRERLLYQLTREGEAAERAVQVFEEQVRAPGELQTTALADIRDLLGELLALLEDGANEELDASKVHRSLESLRARFETLTERAQMFMGGLQRAIDLHGAEEGVFLEYKERLIDYLERFVGELLVSSAAICEAIHQLESAGADRLLLIAAQRDLANRVEEISPALEREASALWRGRWHGLRRWFIGESGMPSQAAVLRARTRAAIPALLSAVAALHDRRLQRTDRREDFRALARWFAEAPTQRDAHRLWHVAFGLDSARHVRVNEETLVAWEALDSPGLDSWATAPRLRVAPRMRQYGRYTRRGRPRNVIDRSQARRQLALQAEKESRRIAAARAHLPVGQTVRLSDLGELPAEAFELLLGLLGEVLCVPPNGHGTRDVESADGAFRIRLELPKDGREAWLLTTDGVLRGVDGRLTLTPRFQLSRAADATASEAPVDQATAR